MSNLQITTKIGCKNACSYCPQERFLKAYKRRSNNILMSLENFRAYIAKLPSEVSIWFAGMSDTQSHAGNVNVLSVPSVVIFRVLDLPATLLAVVNVVFADMDMVCSSSSVKSISVPLVDMSWIRF